MSEPKQPEAASQQPRHAGFPPAAQSYYYPYLYSWPSWPPPKQTSCAAPPQHTHAPGMLSRETASKQLLDMGLPAFSSMAGKQQNTMQSSLTGLPHKSSKTALNTAQPQAQADPYLARLLQQPPPRRQVWSTQPRSAWRAPQPAQSKPTTAKVVSSQHAPGPPPNTSPRVIQEALGAEVYNHFREVLLRQQETLTHQLWELHRLAQLQRHLLSMCSESSGVVDVMATIPRAPTPAPTPPLPPPTTLQQTAGQLSAIELPIPAVVPQPVRNRDGSGSSSGSPMGQHGQSRPPVDGTSGGNDESGKHGSGQHNSCQASNPEQQAAADAGEAGPSHAAAALGSTADPPATSPGVSPPYLSGYSSVPPSAFAHPAAAFTAYGAMPPGAMAAVDPVQAWYHQHYSSMMMSQSPGGMFGRGPGGASKGDDVGMMQWWADPMMMFGQAGMLPSASLAQTGSKATRTKRTRSMDNEEPPAR